MQHRATGRAHTRGLAPGWLAAGLVVLAPLAGPVAGGSHAALADAAVTAEPAEPSGGGKAPAPHASRLLDIALAAALAPGGEAEGLAALGLELRAALRDVTALAAATPPGWLILGAIGVSPRPADRPDLTALVTSPLPHVESSGYGWRDDPFQRFRKFHKGTDYKADRGTPVLAAGPGIVRIAGVQNGYGNVVYIDHGGGVVTRYGHLSKIHTKVGASIAAGERLGLVGATGRATGPHLHFEVRIRGRAVNPVLALEVGALQRTDPAAAEALEAQLAPEIQATALDAQDPTNRRAAKAKRAEARPERAGRAPRDQHLW
jgi:murein DD-endopeptidase MepM/ murein hydrolase activator NlpD